MPPAPAHRGDVMGSCSGTVLSSGVKATNFSTFFEQEDQWPAPHSCMPGMFVASALMFLEMATRMAAAFVRIFTGWNGVCGEEASLSWDERTTSRETRTKENWPAVSPSWSGHRANTADEKKGKQVPTFHTS